MPQHQQSISVPELPASELLALAYGAFQQLGWHTEFALVNRLVGYTKKAWNAYYDHIIVDVEDGNLIITSSLPESATWDLMKRNKKNVAKFLPVFESLKASTSVADIEDWKSKLTGLQQHTETTIVEEQKEAQEVEAVMNLSGSKLVTYVIMGINVLVFIIMVANGVHIMEPTVGDLIKWGADFKPLTLNGEWWRLTTSTFIHIGIIHIALNMYALYMVGIYLEPMLGKWRYIAAYLSTGVLASVASIWWHGSDHVSAGASGAIFGMYGVFLALLTTHLIPKKVRTGLLQSIAVFLVYNLIYAAKSEAIDNAAHLGGLISGFVIGYLYFLSFKKPNFRPAGAAALIVMATIVLTGLYLKNASDDGVAYYQDEAAYHQKVEEIMKIQEVALAPFNNANASNEEMLRDLSTIAQVKWQEAKKIIDETEKFKLDKNLDAHRQLLKEYIDLRLKHTDLAIISLQGRENVDAELQEVSNQISQNVARMNKANEK